jgi:pimeloyl-ACP methyl ester carboxylesterase
MMERAGERMVRANGVDLCLETFGDPEDPAILLIAGVANSMDWWEDEFCERLAAGGRFVIRYDHRDTGRSVSYPPGEPGYTGSDLTVDAAGILDALEVAPGHVVGVSAGGGIGQELALLYPDRVASLTLIATSPVGLTGYRLPPPADRIRAHFSDPPPEPDWSDRAAVVEYIVDDYQPYLGTLPFDEARIRGLAGRVVDRTVNIASSLTNHGLLDQGDTIDHALREITAPTLVLHGTEDPFLPYPHGEALAREIPGARLVPLPGMGHEYPPPKLYDLVIPAILSHTGPG